MARIHILWLIPGKHNNEKHQHDCNEKHYDGKLYDQWIKMSRLP